MEEDLVNVLWLSENTSSCENQTLIETGNVTCDGKEVSLNLTLDLSKAVLSTGYCDLAQVGRTKTVIKVCTFKNELIIKAKKMKKINIYILFNIKIIATTF